MYLKKLKIGNVELENNIILAPMAGITDLPFRVICKKFGPALVCTEMVSSKAIFHNDANTKRLMKIEKKERPVSVQIFGSDEESMEVATKYVNEIADIIDINMGCPAPKVVKNGDGSKLLLDLENAEKIIQTVVKNAKVPVTLKFRKGWDNEHIVACELAKIAEKNGISAITIHGRTRSEFYSGKADWEIIKRVKESVNIPVIANGDIVDEKSALNAFKETNADGIMIGRAAVGNPWIFRNIIYFLQTGEKLNTVNPKEKLDIIKEHLNLEIEEKGELVAIREMRKHISAYTKNLKDSSKFRVEMNKIEDKQKLINLLEDYFMNI